MDFLEANKTDVENSVLVCLKVLDVYFPAVFTMEKCLGMATLDHVITVRTIICKGKYKLKFTFLNHNNR